MKMTRVILNHDAQWLQLTWAHLWYNYWESCNNNLLNHNICNHLTFKFLSRLTNQCSEYKRSLNIFFLLRFRFFFIFILLFSNFVFRYKKRKRCTRVQLFYPVSLGTNLIQFYWPKVFSQRPTFSVRLNWSTFFPLILILVHCRSV